MSQLDALLTQVDQNFDEILSLHRDLVRIPSVNTGFMPTGNETEAADYASQWLGQRGISSEILESDKDRGNLIAEMPGASGQNKLLLMSHLDVVPVEDEAKWNYAPFGAEVDAGTGVRSGSVGLQGAAGLPDDGYEPAAAQRR